MQKTYKFNDIDGVESDDKNPILTAVNQVESGFDKIGRPVDLKGYLRPKAGTEADEENLLITPDLSEDLEEALDVISWLSVNQQIAETFTDDSEVTGSQEMSNIVVRKDLSITEVIELLDDTQYSPDEETDMIQKVIDLVLLVEPSHPNPEVVAAYDILRKGLGWMAEKVLDKTKDFNKALASLDPEGVDLQPAAGSPWTGYDWPDNPDVKGFQLKTMQRVTSQDLDKKEHEIPHLSYQWTPDGISVADMEERYKDVPDMTYNQDVQAKTVAEEWDVKATLVKKSEQVGEMKNHPRPGRVIGKE